MNVAVVLHFSFFKGGNLYACVNTAGLVIYKDQFVDKSPKPSEQNITFSLSEISFSIYGATGNDYILVHSLLITVA